MGHNMNMLTFVCLVWSHHRMILDEPGFILRCFISKAFIQRNQKFGSSLHFASFSLI